MTSAELLAIANRLLYACRDPVTGEPLYAGVSADACVEDVEAAAKHLRQCAQADAVTQCRCTLVAQSVGDGCEVCNPQLAQRLAAEAQADAVEALRGVASEHDIGYAAGWRGCADEASRIVASHIDRLEPGKQRRMRDALLDLLASMQSILVSQRAAKETAR